MDPRDDLLQTPLPPAGGAAGWLQRWWPVRTLQAHHRERVLTHLLELDDTDRALRFGQVVSDDQLRAYVDRIDFERDEVFGIFDRRLRLLATAHLAYLSHDAQAGLAEFGVSVLPRGRGRGFGRRLFDTAVRHARNRGAHTLVIHLARHNTPMLAIVRGSGASVRYEGADAVAHLTLPAQDLRSQVESLAESGAAELDYRLKRDALRWRRWLGLSRR
jgi:ribosomal protein S18 acetylase RimI-like enzyme